MNCVYKDFKKYRGLAQTTLYFFFLGGTDNVSGRNSVQTYLYQPQQLAVNPSGSFFLDQLLMPTKQVVIKQESLSNYDICLFFSRRFTAGQLPGLAFTNYLPVSRLVLLQEGIHCRSGRGNLNLLWNQNVARLNTHQIPFLNVTLLKSTFPKSLSVTIPDVLLF